MSILALLLAAAAPAQPAALRAELQPLAFLAGSCWRGSFPDRGGTDTHCFTAIYGGAFVRDRHIVEGAERPYSGETLYRWDVARRQIVYDYYAADGSYSSGIAQPGPRGVVFPAASHSSRTGTETGVRSRWTLEGSDSYVVEAESLHGGNIWHIMFEMRMERIGPASAD
jgi:hypothetical protein